MFIPIQDNREIVMSNNRQSYNQREGNLSSKALAPSPLLTLPPELIERIWKALPLESLNNFRRVNKQCAMNAKDIQVIKHAREYGYEGDSFEGAKEYLRQGFTSMLNNLVAKEYLPAECLVYQDQLAISATCSKIKEHISKRPCCVNSRR